MASLRGGAVLFADDTTVNNAGGTVDASQAAYIGTAPYVCVFIDNDGPNSATFKVQAAGLATPSAGLNNLPTEWYDYEKVSGTPFSIVVASTIRLAVELSPFAPQLFRLVRTDASGDTSITAFAVAVST